MSTQAELEQFGIEPRCECCGARVTVTVSCSITSHCTACIGRNCHTDRENYCHRRSDTSPTEAR